MLEATLVILPLFALGFALMDYSVAIFVQNTLRNAAREGVRYAITQQTGPGGQDAAIKSVVQQNSMGFLSSTSYITISYYDQNLNPVSGSGSNAAGNICVVSITGYPWTWFAPVLRPGGSVSFSASSADMMEAPPNGVLPSR